MAGMVRRRTLAGREILSGAVGYVTYPRAMESDRIRTVAWEKEPPEGGMEWVEIALRRDRLRASGVALGGKPVPYRLDYELETASRFVTTRLKVQARGDGWRRSIDLWRSPAGGWAARTEADGALDGPAAGGDIDGLADALDCDLASSPTTNTMPVLRHGLLDGGEYVEFTMAWVLVPNLAVVASRQRYVPIRSIDRAGGSPAVIRYESGAFRSDITFDDDGLVIDYPQLATRLGPS
jgi:uncharacterized protein